MLSTCAYIPEISRGERRKWDCSMATTIAGGGLSNFLPRSVSLLWGYKPYNKINKPKQKPHCQNKIPTIPPPTNYWKSCLLINQSIIYYPVFKVRQGLAMLQSSYLSLSSSCELPCANLAFCCGLRIMASTPMCPRPAEEQHLPVRPTTDGPLIVLPVLKVYPTKNAQGDSCIFKVA